MEIVLIGMLTVLAAGTGTLSGFGTSTIMVPVLLLVYPLPQTLLLVGIIHLFGDVWKLVLFREGIRWNLILAFGIPGAVASYAGARVMLVLPDLMMLRVLGGFFIAYVVFLVLNPAFRLAPNSITAACGGTLSGFMAGIFGVGGAVRSAFLTVFNLPKAVYIATAGAIAMAIDCSRLATYLSGGAILPGRLLVGLLVFIPASFLGAKIAKVFVDRIPQNRYRAVVAVFLLAVGIKLLLFAV